MKDSKENVTEEIEKSNYEESVFEDEKSLDNGNVSYSISLNLKGWLKYALDPDPWNEENYNSDCASLFCNEGVLSRQLVSKCISKLVQLPDTQYYVFSRLHLNKKVSKFLT